MITQNSFKMLRNLRYKIFGAASKEDIKELLRDGVHDRGVGRSDNRTERHRDIKVMLP